MKDLLFVLLLIVSVAFCSNCMTETLTEIDESDLIFYDSDSETNELIPSRTDSDSPVLPPPGSELLRIRKRSASCHFPSNSIESYDTRELFCDPESFNRDSIKRTDSEATLVENWEGFIMCRSELYGTRHNSFNNSVSETENVCEKPPKHPSNDRKINFAQLGKSRSKSFSKKEKHIAKLSSHSEDEESDGIR